MPAVQSTYPAEMPAAYAGMIANTEPNNLISREVQTAAIPFGRAVKQGTAENQIQAATAATDVVRGITARDQSSDPTSADAAAVGASALVVERGVVWAVAGAAVTATDVGKAVYMVVGTGQAGKFTPASASNLLIPNAVFDSIAASDALVKIRIG